MSALLGLQAASQAPEWWQTDPDAALNFGASNFGQDAAMPMVADSMNALALPMPTAPTVGSQSMPAVEINSARENADIRSMVDFSQVSEPISDGSAAVLAGMDVKALLQTPMEELQPKQVQQILSSVWGDVKEVKVEDAPESSHADPTQHSLMKLMAKNVETDNRPQTQTGVAEKASAKPEMPLQEATSQSLPDTAPKLREEKKQSETPFLVNAEGGRIQDSSDTFAVATKTDAGHVATTPKLMPQVLPKLEDLVQQGGGKLTMLLDPPELGKLTIELTTRGKNVEVSIHSDSQQTRTALEGGMADLQQALQSQDLNLTSAEVHVARESSFASMNFGQGPSQHGQSSSREGSGSFSRSREERLWSRDLLAEAPVTRNRVAGRLDVRV